MYRGGEVALADSSRELMQDLSRANFAQLAAAAAMSSGLHINKCRGGISAKLALKF